MIEPFRRLLGRRGGTGATRAPLRRLTLPGDPTLVYAIGDVHGCLEKLRALEEAIVADAEGIVGLKLLVMLGDYVDRGPDSAGVIDRLIDAPPPGFRRVCLRGNHDDLMLQALRQPGTAAHWLELGGRETLLSYGYDLEHLSKLDRRDTLTIVAQFAAAFPEPHLLFLQSLPVVLETASYTFVHAGLRPDRTLDQQSDNDLLWIRNPFIDHAGPPFAKPVVHGHTPVVRPVVSRYRIAVDTGAYLGGPLTAVRLSANGIRIIAVD